MQINGGQFNAVYAPRTQVQDAPSRPPVIIDVTADNSPSNAGYQQVVNPTQIVTPSAATTELQSQIQSRYVRTFAAIDNSEPSQQQSQQLPREVKQYLQISQLNTEDTQHILDEQV